MKDYCINVVDYYFGNRVVYTRIKTYIMTKRNMKYRSYHTIACSNILFINTKLERYNIYNRSEDADIQEDGTPFVIYVNDCEDNKKIVEKLKNYKEEDTNE